MMAKLRCMEDLERLADRFARMEREFPGMIHDVLTLQKNPDGSIEGPKLDSDYPDFAKFGTTIPYMGEGIETNDFLIVHQLIRRQGQPWDADLALKKFEEAVVLDGIEAWLQFIFERDRNQYRPSNFYYSCENLLTTIERHWSPGDVAAHCFCSDILTLSREAVATKTRPAENESMQVKYVALVDYIQTKGGCTKEAAKTWQEVIKDRKILKGVSCVGPGGEEWTTGKAKRYSEPELDQIWGLIQSKFPEIAHATQ